MTVGGFLGSVVLKMTAMLHGALAEYVSVANVAAGDGGEELRFTVLPAGVGFSEWLAGTAEIYVGLLTLVAVVPRLGSELARLFIVLMW